MIKLKQILKEVVTSDDIKFIRRKGDSIKGIDTYHIPDASDDKLTLDKYKEFIHHNFIDECGYRTIVRKFSFKNDSDGAQNHVIVDPRQDFNQKSVDTNNLYYILFSDLDSWKEYNKHFHNHRAKSIKFSNDKNMVLNDYVASNSVVYRVYPKKDAKVFCSPYKNGFLEMPYMRSKTSNNSFYNFADFIKNLTEFLTITIKIIISDEKSKSKFKGKFKDNDIQYLGRELRDTSIIKKIYEFFKDFEVTKEFLSSLENQIKSMKNNDIEFIFKNFEKMFTGDGQKLFYDFLNDIFDPVKNEILLLEADSSEFKSILKSVNKTYEIWTSDLCFVEIDREYIKRGDFINRDDESFFKQ